MNRLGIVGFAITAVALGLAAGAGGCGGDNNGTADGGGGGNPTQDSSMSQGDSSGGSSGGQPVDAGPACPPNTTQCVNSTLARVCPSDGSGWLAVTCAPGQTCTNGTGCAGTVGDGGTGCTPNTTQCLSSTIEEICPSNGSGWLAVPCAQGNTCTTGGDAGTGCTPASITSCTPGSGSCINSTTALVCNAGGTAYQQVSCPTNTTCGNNGSCNGAVRVGSSFCVGDNPSTTIATSTDGYTYTNSTCASGQYCVSTGTDSAACKTGTCVPGANGCSSVCGNEVNSSANQSEYLSTCIATPNGYQWIAVQCSSPETCNPSGTTCAGGPAPECMNTCTPGATRCNTGGLQTCDGTGNWGNPPVACDASSGKVCGNANGQSYCGDPVCFASTPGPGTTPGTCLANGDFLPCDSNYNLESLDAGAACPAGATCQPTHSGPPLSGLYQPGACQQICQAGESQCAGPSGYQTCGVNGWGATTSCDAGSCQQYTPNPGSMFTLAVCGTCIPGSAQCVAAFDGGAPNSGVQTCDTTGSWGAIVACQVGACEPSTGGAACLAQCIPGSNTCNMDGGEIGICTATGALPTTFSPCSTAGQTCRNDYSGNYIGCLDCRGPNHGGAADGECVNAADGGTGNTGIQTCGPSDTWNAPNKCPSGLDGGAETCIGFTPSTCGVFSPMYGPPLAGETETASNISAATMGHGTCSNYGPCGGPGPCSEPCGGYPDCCDWACTPSAPVPVCH